MLELDCKESWVPKNWCFWTVVLEKTLESPLDCKEMQPVHSKGDQPWDFFGRNDAKAETPVLWPPHAKSWLIGKDSDAGRDWGQEEKRTTEDEMVGWHHRLDGHEFEWTPGVGDGQGGLVCCDSWGCKELDMTEWLNWTELNWGVLMLIHIILIVQEEEEGWMLCSWLLTARLVLFLLEPSCSQNCINQDFLFCVFDALTFGALISQWDRLSQLIPRDTKQLTCLANMPCKPITS